MTMDVTSPRRASQDRIRCAEQMVGSGRMCACELRSGLKQDVEHIWRRPGRRRRQPQQQQHQHGRAAEEKSDGCRRGKPGRRFVIVRWRPERSIPILGWIMSTGMMIPERRRRGSCYDIKSWINRVVSRAGWYYRLITYDAETVLC